MDGVLAFVVLLWGEPVSGFVTPSPAVCEEILAVARDDMRATRAANPYGLAVGGAIARPSDWSAECRPLSEVPAAWLEEWRS